MKARQKVVPEGSAVERPAAGRQSGRGNASLFHRSIAILAMVVVFGVAGVRGEEMPARASMEIRTAKAPELVLTAGEANGRGVNLVPQPKAFVASRPVEELSPVASGGWTAAEPWRAAKAGRGLFVRVSLVGIIELRI